MFIRTQETPNPNALKFLPGQTVSLEGNLEFSTIEEASGISPMAEELLRLEGVQKVFLGSDFIVITKDENTEWYKIKPYILGTLMDSFLFGGAMATQAGTKAPSDIGKAGGTNATYQSDEGTEEIVEHIKELLADKIQPAVAQDGGFIEFSHFSNGIVYVKMMGSCAGCPSSTMTLKNGIENLLRFYIPEVTEVRSI